MRNLHRRIRSTIAALPCLLIGLMAGPAGADLALEIGAPKTHYLLDEPLFVTVTIRNNGPGDAAVIPWLDPGADLLTFRILPPGDAERQYRPCVALNPGPGALPKAVAYLGPGEKYSEVVDLTCERRIKGGRVPLVLASPGEYVVQAKYAVAEGWLAYPITVQSNRLSLVVLEPQGEDLAAYDLLRQGAATGERGPWNAAAEQAVCYEALLRQFPRSPYAVHARFYLAQVYEEDGEERPLRGTVQGAAAMDKAAMLYLAVAREAGLTPLGVYALRLAARCNAKVGRAPEAQALLEQSFVSPAATEEDRLEALSWLHHVETGMFLESSGLASGPVAATELRLPLREFAKALGLTVDWDPSTRTGAIVGSRVAASLQPDEHRLVIKGRTIEEVEAWVTDAGIQVRPWLVGALFAQRYSSGEKRAMSDFVDTLRWGPPETRQREPRVK